METGRGVYLNNSEPTEGTTVSSYPQNLLVFERSTILTENKSEDESIGITMEAQVMSDEQRVALERRIENQIRAKAKRRVGLKLGFMWHFAVFAMVMLALVAINLNYTPNTLWVVWPLGGWGAGVILHAFAVFSTPRLTEEMIEAEIEREKKRRGIL